MTVITREHYIEVTADEGKSLHRVGEDLYCKTACMPLESDVSVWEEVLDSEVPTEDDEPDDYYAEAGRILLGKETD